MGTSHKRMAAQLN